MLRINYVSGIATIHSSKGCLQKKNFIWKIIKIKTRVLTMMNRLRTRAVYIYTHALACMHAGAAESWQRCNVYGPVSGTFAANVYGRVYALCG